MNKKLFDTRMNSVNHYLKEIEDLKRAERITEQTLDELARSFKEFVPFKSGDLILIEDQIYKVYDVSKTDLQGSGIEILLKILYPSKKGGYEGDTYGPGTLRVKFCDLDRIKIIYSKTDEQ